MVLLIALGLLLTSYAMASGWTQSRIASGSSPTSKPDGAATDAVTSILTTPAPAPDQAPGEDRMPRAASLEEGQVVNRPLGVEDGFIPDDVVLSPWNIDHPAVANLHPALLDAVQRAATDAEAEGIVMVINSGWRSERYQRVLLDEAVVTYGSEEEARKWMSAPDTSTHVTGDGVDIGYTDADYWLIEHGNAYGLCQTYENEIWHFELAVEPGETCPPPLPDASGSPEVTAGEEGVIPNRPRMTGR